MKKQPKNHIRKSLTLARESVRLLTERELPDAHGGSCPTGSWPSDKSLNAAESACAAA